MMNRDVDASRGIIAGLMLSALLWSVLGGLVYVVWRLLP